MFTTRNSMMRGAARSVVVGVAVSCFAGLSGVAVADTIAPVSLVTGLPTSTPISGPCLVRVPPIPGTNSGWGTATSCDASGRPTHVTYAGTVAPPTTYVPMGCNSPLYDCAGRPKVPSLPPSGSGTMVGGVALPPPARSGPTHVTLPYIPAQVPGPVRPPNPLDYPSTPAQRQAAAERAKLLNEQANGTFADAAGIGYSNGAYNVNGKTFNDRGSAIFEKNHPSPR